MAEHRAFKTLGEIVLWIVENIKPLLVEEVGNSNLAINPEIWTNDFSLRYTIGDLSFSSCSYTLAMVNNRGKTEKEIFDAFVDEFRCLFGCAKKFVKQNKKAKVEGE